MLIFAPHNQLFLYPGPCSVFIHPCDPTGSLVHRIVLARILEGSRYFLLQGIFLTLGLNLKFHLQHCRQIFITELLGGLPMENSLHLFKDITKFLPNHLGLVHYCIPSNKLGLA